MKEYEIHAIAKCYPNITGKDFTELRKSIREQGLLNPITLYEGKILDGANRYRACLEENVVPTYQGLPEGVDPILYVISQNESRRHLTVEQRAFIGAKIARLRAGGDRRSSAFKSSTDGASTEAVASKLKISSKSIERARRVQKTGAPEVVEAAESGAVNLSQAEQIAALPREQQKSAVETAKSTKAAVKAAKDVTQSEEFKTLVSKHQSIIDAPSIYPIDLPVPAERAQMIKDLRANEKVIGAMEGAELGKNTHRFAETLSKDQTLDKRFAHWASSVKRKIAARHLILDEAKNFKKAEKAEKKSDKAATPAKKVAAIDRQWQVFVPQFKALLKLFSKDDRPEIRHRIEEMLTQTWPNVLADGGVVIS